MPEGRDLFFLNMLWIPAADASLDAFLCAGRFADKRAQGPVMSQRFDAFLFLLPAQAALPGFFAGLCTGRFR